MADFIGSVISLISKRDIRYKGTLHAINSDNHTVALENVTSFGTEGRRNGVDEVPPQDEVYEYIVFRGTDVKELSIEEAPVSSKPSLASQDPAIVETRRPHPGQPSGASDQPADPTPRGNQPSTQAPPGPPQYHGYQSYGPPYPSGGEAPYAQSQYASPGPSYPYSSYPPPPQFQGQPGPSNQAPHASGPQSHRHESRPSNSGPVELGSFDTYNPDQAGSGQSTGGAENADLAENAESQQAPSQAQPRKILQRGDEDAGPAELPTQSSLGRAGHHTGRGGHAENRRQGAGNGYVNWENANAKFQQLALSEKPVNAADSQDEVADESKPGAAEAKPPAYDRGKSFFDNISSDLSSRQDGRDRQFRDNERRKNLETFGQGSVDTLRPRGGFSRGRGRGRGGSSGPGYRPRGRSSNHNLPAV